MIKNVLLLIFSLFQFSTVFAQNRIEGKLENSGDYTYALLYKVNGAERQFIDNKNLVNGNFRFDLAESLSAGVYRVVFDYRAGLYLDVYYNTKESISFTLDPSNPEFTVVFSNSIENKVFYEFFQEKSLAQVSLDQVQLDFLTDPSKANSDSFQVKRKELLNIQNLALQKSSGLFVEPFIRANIRKNPQEPVSNGLEYLQYVKNHYFDNLDFRDKSVLNSDYFYTKITDYVFYLNSSQDPEKQDDLYKEAIGISLNQDSSDDFKSTVTEIFINQFKQFENLEMVNFLMKNYYEKFPLTFQNQEFVKETRLALATAVGNNAPDFTWDKNGRQTSLYNQLGTGSTILVFWSSSCSHCLKEIPELYQITKSNKSYQVIALGMEEESLEWDKMIESMPQWTHVLALEKWENPIARSYNIIGTPTYIILNNKGVITQKPKDLSELIRWVKTSNPPYK
jgi:thiol-disulfide isomerase/thioredoxin